MFKPLDIQMDMEVSFFSYRYILYVPEFDYRFSIYPPSRGDTIHSLPINVIINLFTTNTFAIDSIEDKIKNRLLTSSDFKIRINGVEIDSIYGLREQLLLELELEGDVKCN